MDRFCTNCGQKIPDNSEFCTNCGTKVGAQPAQQFQNAPQQNYGQPQNQGYAQGTQNQQYYNPNQNNNHNMNQNVDPKLKSKNSLALALAIVGLCVGIIGSMLFGVFLAIPSLACGVVAVIFAIDVKKKSNNTLGQGAMVVGILAIVFSSIFTIGCATCGSGSYGYGCYGCIGGSCKAGNDVSDAYDYLDSFNF